MKIVLREFMPCSHADGEDEPGKAEEEDLKA
jgi:hypothetical protein